MNKWINEIRSINTNADRDIISIPVDVLFSFLSDVSMARERGTEAAAWTHRIAGLAETSRQACAGSSSLIIVLFLPCFVDLEERQLPNPCPEPSRSFLVNTVG